MACKSKSSHHLILQITFLPFLPAPRRRFIGPHLTRPRTASAESLCPSWMSRTTSSECPSTTSLPELPTVPAKVHTMPTCTTRTHTLTPSNTNTTRRTSTVTRLVTSTHLKMRRSMMGMPTFSAGTAVAVEADMGMHRFTLRMTPSRRRRTTSAGQRVAPRDREWDSAVL